MPNPRREILSEEAIIGKTRSAIGHLKDCLERGKVIDHKNDEDRGAVLFAVYNRLDLPREEWGDSIEVLANLWGKGLLRRPRLFDFIGWNAHRMRSEVLGNL